MCRSKAERVRLICGCSWTRPVIDYGIKRTHTQSCTDARYVIVFLSRWADYARACACRLSHGSNGSHTNTIQDSAGNERKSLSTRPGTPIRPIEVVGQTAYSPTFPPLLRSADMGVASLLVQEILSTSSTKSWLFGDGKTWPLAHALLHESIAEGCYHRTHTSARLGTCARSRVYMRLLARLQWSGTRPGLCCQLRQSCRLLT